MTPKPPSRTVPAWKRFFLATIFPWFVVLIGALATYLGVENVLRARASTSWPSVDGTVIRAGIDRERSQATPSSTAQSITWRPVIVYEYVVDAVRYEGGRISFGAYATSDRGDAEAVLSRYPTGARVPVYFNPDDPGQAVIEPGTAGVPWFFVALGSVFLVAGLAAAVLFPKLVARGLG